ncbi:conjugal transfer protein TraC, partial [candidate division NPL-UPA2 bacterium]|nr:conjugal transfer protein TraC [candidate division NPL-UPA2 bacterium]
LCQKLEGSWIDCGGGAGGRINPLQVKEVPTDEDEENSGKGALAGHFQTLRTFFRLYMKEVSDMERAQLELALEELYKAFKVTWETDTSALKSTDWPTLKDLYELIKKEPGQEKLALLLRRAAEGADSALWSGHSTIHADSDFVVLDVFALQESSEEIKRAQYFNVLSWAWNEIAKDRRQKVILAVDEAYLLVDPETPQALQFLRNTSKRIRKYGGSLAVISQNINDFLDPAVRRHGQALLDNPCYKLIMGQGEKDLESLVQLMHLSEAEQEMLGQGKRGEALLVAGSKRVHARIELAAHEPELFGEGGGR